LDSLGEAEEEADGQGGEDEDDHAADEGDGDAPPAEDLVTRVVGNQSGLLPHVPGGVGCKQADLIGREGLEDASDDECAAGDVTDECAEEDDDAGDPFGGEAEGRSEQGEG